MSSDCFIFGFGYTAKVLAPKLIAQGFKVIATSRTPDEQAHNNLEIKFIDFDSLDMENYLGLALLTFV